MNSETTRHNEMILKYYVDPEIFASYRQFNEIYRHFGFNKRRVIIAFPDNWITRVRNCQKKSRYWTPMQKEKFKVWIDQKAKYFLVQHNRKLPKFSPPQWVECAIMFNDIYHDFYTIISSSHPQKKNDYIICPFLENTNASDFRDHPRFQNGNGIFHMENTEEGFEKAFGTIAANSEYIILIDRFFSGTEKKRDAILRAIFNKIPENSNLIPKIVIPTDSNENDCRNIGKNIESESIHIIGKRKLKIIFIREFEYTNIVNITHHDRFFISDKCAVTIGPGFAIERPKIREIFLLNMLDQETHKLLFDCYKGDSEGNIPNTVFQFTINIDDK